MKHIYFVGEKRGGTNELRKSQLDVCNAEFRTVFMPEEHFWIKNSFIWVIRGKNVYRL